LDNHAAELVLAVKGEMEIYIGLLQYAKQKKEALVNNDLDGLNIIVKHESESLLRLKGAAAARETLFKKQAEEGSARADFDYIKEMLPQRERSQMEELGERYREIVQELSLVNALNQKLLQTQLQYTTFCLDLLTETSPIGGTYCSTGQLRLNKSDKRTLIDKEA